MKDVSSSEIHKDMVQIFGKYGPSHATVKHWDAEFKRDKDNIEDETWLGSVSIVTTSEKFDRSLEIMMADRRMSSHQETIRTGISQEQADNILTNELGMSKVLAL